MRSGAVAHHWQEAYEARPHDRHSWFEPVPERSLAWIAASGVPRDAAIVDVGGGASTLAPELVARGYEDVTVVDVSAAALERARRLAGPAAEEIAWIEADVTEGLEGAYELWHDRAVFHFMTTAAERAAYARSMLAALRPGGHAVIATFGPRGPTRCSGLDVRRYSAPELARELGEELELIGEEQAVHTTPGGAEQQFTWALLRRRAS